MEEWKDIIGYEGIYKISNLGNILSQKRRGGGGILIPHLGNNGYLTIMLRNKGNDKKYTVHRLIAIHFIDNPYNHPCVDHIDRNRQNNQISNLRWVDYKTNNSNRIQKGYIGINKRIHKDKVYEYIKTTYYLNQKRKNKNFKTKEEAEEFLKKVFLQD